MNDPLANKNLIYYARDAIVAIGYAGKAYGLNSSNKNMPTDEWIAEKLWGKPIPRGLDGAPGTLIFQKIGRHLNIGQSIKLLQNELITSFDALPRSQRKRARFHLALAGWRESRHGVIRYMIAEIKRNNETFTIESPPRYYYRMRSRTCLLSFPDGYISQTHLSEILARLKPLTPDESETLLVDEIRRIAALYPGKVGPHCMSILVPPQPTYPVRVRFIPTVEHTAVINIPRKGISKTLAVAFSPWIIGPGMVSAPAVMNGNSTLHMGPIKISIDAPVQQHGITIQYSLRRPPSS
jgi:hypothetical protein